VSSALSKVADLMSDEAWEIGNPEIINAVLVFETADGKVQALPWIKGNRSGFGHAVMRTGAQLLDAPDTKN
jgi:hypothetical protein